MEICTRRKYGGVDVTFVHSPELERAAFFRNIARDDDRALLPRILAPTLLITGALDREVPPAVGLFMRQRIPNAHLIEIPGGDHFVFATRPELVNRMLEQFFASATRCGPR
jgi:non-heme chloroperoxidase